MAKGGEWHTIPLVSAVCYTCDWRCDAKNAHAVGAIHARSHGHYVDVQVCRDYVYNHDPEMQDEEEV
jgi:hypothetical protein